MSRRLLGQAGLRWGPATPIRLRRLLRSWEPGRPALVSSLFLGMLGVTTCSRQHGTVHREQELLAHSMSHMHCSLHGAVASAYMRCACSQVKQSCRQRLRVPMTPLPCRHRFPLAAASTLMASPPLRRSCC